MARLRSAGLKRNKFRKNNDLIKTISVDYDLIDSCRFC